MDPFKVTGCARCGKSHLVEPSALERPAIISDVRITHWAACPTNGEPILIQTIEDKLTDQ